MAQEKTLLIHNILKSKVEELEKKYVRNVMKESLECSARCCSNEEAPLEQMNVCMNNCSVKLKNVQNFIHTEFGNFQSRVDRCFADCYEDIRYKLNENSSQSEVKEMEKIYDGCASGCIDKHIEILPTFMQKMHETLRAALPRVENQGEPVKFIIHNL